MSDWLYHLLYSNSFSGICGCVALLSGMGLFVTLFITASRISIEIDRENFRLTWWFLGQPDHVQGRTEDISWIKLNRIRLPLAKKQITSCILGTKLRKPRFGLFLTQQENEWLVGEIRTFLAEWR